jgi:hypothetical protein
VTSLTRSQFVGAPDMNVTLTWMPRPVEGMKASTVVVKSAPANFSFSLFLPCSDHAGLQYRLTMVVKAADAWHSHAASNAYAGSRTNETTSDVSLGARPLLRQCQAR